MNCLLRGATWGSLALIAGAAAAAPASLAGETLATGLPRLGRALRQPLAAGPTVKDRRLLLFARDRPAAEVTRQIARFVPFSPGTAFWQQGGGTLVLDEDIHSREARLLSARKKQAALREERGRRYQRLSRDVPRLQAEEKREPKIEYLLLGLPREARDRALAGYPVRVPVPALGAKAQETARRFFRNPNIPLAQMMVEVKSTTIPEQAGLKVVLLAYEGSRMAGGILCPDALNPARMDRQENPTWEYLIEPYLNRRRGPEGAAEQRALQRKVSIDGGTPTEMLQRLSEAAGLPVIGEYDGSVDFPVVAPIKGKPVHEAMEEICRRFDLNWDWQGGWLWVRSPRTWRAVVGELDLSPPR